MKYCVLTITLELSNKPHKYKITAGHHQRVPRRNPSATSLFEDHGKTPGCISKLKSKIHQMLQPSHGDGLHRRRRRGISVARDMPHHREKVDEGYRDNAEQGRTSQRVDSLAHKHRGHDDAGPVRRSKAVDTAPSQSTPRENVTAIRTIGSMHGPNFRSPEVPIVRIFGKASGSNGQGTQVVAPPILPAARIRPAGFEVPDGPNQRDQKPRTVTKAITKAFHKGKSLLHRRDAIEPRSPFYSPTDLTGGHGQAGRRLGKAERLGYKSAKTTANNSGWTCGKKAKTMVANGGLAHNNNEAMPALEKTNNSIDATQVRQAPSSDAKAALRREFWDAKSRLVSAQRHFDAREEAQDDAFAEYRQDGERVRSQASQDMFDLRWVKHTSKLTRDLIAAEEAFHEAKAAAIRAGCYVYDDDISSAFVDRRSDGYGLSYEAEMSAEPLNRERVERWRKSLPALMDHHEAVSAPVYRYSSVTGNDPESWESSSCVAYGTNRARIRRNEQNCIAIGKQAVGP